MHPVFKQKFRPKYAKNFLKKSNRKTVTVLVRTGALGAHQHTLHSFKKTFLSRIYTKICLKMLYFWRKSP